MVEASTPHALAPHQPTFGNQGQNPAEHRFMHLMGQAAPRLRQPGMVRNPVVASRRRNSRNENEFAAAHRHAGQDGPHGEHRLETLARHEQMGGEAAEPHAVAELLDPTSGAAP